MQTAQIDILFILLQDGSCSHRAADIGCQNIVRIRIIVVDKCRPAWIMFLLHPVGQNNLRGFPVDHNGADRHVISFPAASFLFIRFFYRHICRMLLYIGIL